MTSSASQSGYRLLYVVQMPPPLHGVAVMNQRVVDSARINRGIDARVLSFRSSVDLDELGRLQLVKLARLLRLFAAFTIELFRFRPQAVYLAPVPAGSAFLRDALLLGFARALGVRRIAHLHGVGVGAASAAHGWLYRLAFGGAEVIDLSPGVGGTEWRHLQAELGARHCVPNALTPDVHRALVCARAAPRDRGTAPPELLFLSTAFESKGILVLLDALLQQRSALRCHVVGQIPEALRQPIEQRISAMPAQVSVTLHGPLLGEAKFRRLLAADLFVHPTLNDYFPLVVLEAMAAGLPIIASRVGALPEMLEGEAGYLIEPADVPALALALAELLDQPCRRVALGQRARQRYLQHYAPEGFDNRMRKVLLGSLQKPR